MPVVIEEYQIIKIQDSEGGLGFYYINWLKTKSVIFSTNINIGDIAASQPILYPGSTEFRADLYDFFAAESVEDVLQYMTDNNLSFK